MNGNLSELLGGPFVALMAEPQWETRTPESEWVTAAPAQPLAPPTPAELAEPEEEPPGLEQHVMEWAAIEGYRTRTPAYKQMTGRYEVYDIERLRELIAGRSYSTLINRPVLCLRDALDHEINLAIMWSQEDQEEAELAALRIDEVPPAIDLADHELAAGKVEELRKAWRDAVAERDRVHAEHQLLVRAARTAYQEAKARL